MAVNGLTNDPVCPSENMVTLSMAQFMVGEFISYRYQFVFICFYLSVLFLLIVFLCLTLIFVVKEQNKIENANIHSLIQGKWSFCYQNLAFNFYFFFRLAKKIKPIKQSLSKSALTNFVLLLLFD